MRGGRSSGPSTRCYRSAARVDRGRILDEFCETTGYQRKYALRLLNGPPPGPERPRRRRRPATYGPAVIQALTAIWEAAGYPWSVRLKALLPQWLPWARRRLRPSATGASAPADDQRPADGPAAGGSKRRLKRRGYGRTKPGTLKHHIPLKTDHWDVTEPGFVEVDLVSHSGECASGEFVYSLNVTDIHTGWVETARPDGPRRDRRVAALDEIRRRLPFPLRGIDSDNGSEFINYHLDTYCQERQIQFTRGRPYKKDDNAHIEQKNWTHVRRIFGWDRYDTLAVLDAMNDLYTHELPLLMNLYQPSVKLRAKERVGTRLRRRYDAARTPLERVQACPEADPQVVAALVRLRD